MSIIVFESKCLERVASSGTSPQVWCLKNVADSGIPSSYDFFHFIVRNATSTGLRPESIKYCGLQPQSNTMPFTAGFKPAYLLDTGRRPAPVGGL